MGDVRPTDIKALGAEGALEEKKLSIDALLRRSLRMLLLPFCHAVGKQPTYSVHELTALHVCH